MDVGKKLIENVDDTKMIRRVSVSDVGCGAGLFWECFWTLTFSGEFAAEWEYAANFTDVFYLSFNLNISLQIG